MPSEYEPQHPETEQEVPPEVNQTVNITNELSPAFVANMERANLAKKAEQEIHLKDNAFWLLCGCLVGCLFLFIFDSVAGFFGKSSSDTLTNLLDLGKTVITFLLGYLFAYEKIRK